ncbi:major pollen allergen Ole e 10-like isoform X1 [Ananas comosus]|uniref:Major pollen allergen Ole e 10-like isoform X1 n=1 Tax=Ananas comosus TaxID=4615 RepID=A0A6P5G2D1_ANACO|nr:major pollen allergen Ole e 10-like isoform X1 [Ananas comosus]
MAQRTFIMFVAILLLLSSPGGLAKRVPSQKTWCVPKPYIDSLILQGNINFVCSEVDCGSIKPGGPCFAPDTSMNHASVAMNLYYQQHGRWEEHCEFKGSGLIAITDPSNGDCKW